MEFEWHLIATAFEEALDSRFFSPVNFTDLQHGNDLEVGIRRLAAICSIMLKMSEVRMLRAAYSYRQLSHRVSWDLVC